MDTERFEELVIRAVEGLPDELQERLENVDIVVADRPTPDQLAYVDNKKGSMLLGLYEGVPLTERSSFYGMVAPDKITIFQEAITEACRSETEMVSEIRRVVLHEIAHHFGISDARLKELGM